MIRKLLCRLGFHLWVPWAPVEEGYYSHYECSYCGKIRL